MSETTNDDAEFTPEQLALFAADAAEAEAGYSIEFLRSCRRLPGRPRELGEEAGVMVRFRMDRKRLRDVDARAAAEDISRSQFIRDAIDRALV